MDNKILRHLRCNLNLFLVYDVISNDVDHMNNYFILSRNSNSVFSREYAAANKCSRE